MTGHRVEIRGFHFISCIMNAAIENIPRVGPKNFRISINDKTKISRISYLSTYLECTVPQIPKYFFPLKKYLIGFL